MQRDGRKSGLPLGERIKSRRKELGLTLQQLANASGLSAPFISQAERDLTTPSLVSLLALAKALEVEIDHFMLIPDTGDIVHRADEPKILQVNSPVTYVDLSSPIANRQMDATVMHIPAGHVFPIDQRNGEDLLYVISGELWASAGQTTTTLKAGDSVHFDARLPHMARNDSDEKAVVLYVRTPSENRR